MSAEAASPSRQTRQGLRIAAAASVGFTAAVALGQSLPFLAPMFAVQFLTASGRPPGLRQAAGMVALIVVAGWVAAALTQLCGDRPAALLPLLGLVYFTCFMLQATGRGGGAPFLIIVIALMIPMFGILRTEIGEGVVPLLAKAALGGAALTWLAHAAFPDPGGDEADPATSAARVDRPVRLALANAAIILVLLVVCLVDDRFSTAVIVPITAASLLGQFDHAAGGRAALGLMVLNLLGGVIASLAFTLIELRPTVPFLFLTVLTAALLFGGRAADDPAAGKIYAGALTTFLILLGLGVSPSSGDVAESFATRIGMVAFAIVATFWLTALLWPASAAPQGRPR